MKVRELLDSEEKWTKRLYARDASGASVSPNDDKAVCWCLIGAIRYCYPDRVHGVFERVENHLRGKGALKIDELCIGASEWNDAPKRTFEEVKQLVDELDI
jgi:hypothetical protein